MHARVPPSHCSAPEQGILRDVLMSSRSAQEVSAKNAISGGLHLIHLRAPYDYGDGMANFLFRISARYSFLTASHTNCRYSAIL